MNKIDPNIGGQLVRLDDVMSQVTVVLFILWVNLQAALGTKCIFTKVLINSTHKLTPMQV